MNLEETIKFLKDIHVGEHVKIEYLSFFGKTKSIEGLAYSMRPWSITVTKKPDINIFVGLRLFEYKDIMLGDITKYQVIEQKK